jgi:hypothetical protein
MNQNFSDQHGSGSIRKPNSTSSSPQNLFQLGTQNDTMGDPTFANLGGGVGALLDPKQQLAAMQNMNTLQTGQPIVTGSMNPLA